jgi:NAD(P)-dependent dehydrogenase (short-subunit alcohol dehydrogenase family)
MRKAREWWVSLTAHEVEGSEEQLKLSSFSLRLSSECFTPTEPCDVTSKASTTSLFTFAQTVFNGQPPDIVIANAGVNEVGHLEDDVVLHNQHGVYPKKPGQITLDVNLSGAILTAEVARRAWKDTAQEPGHALARQRKLILISSMGGWEGIPMGTLYSMAKHGLLGYWVALAAEQERLKDDTFSYVVAIFLFSTWSLSHPASN